VIDLFILLDSLGGIQYDGTPEELEINIWKVLLDIGFLRCNMCDIGLSWLSFHVCNSNRLSTRL